MLKSNYHSFIYTLNLKFTGNVRRRARIRRHRRDRWMRPLLDVGSPQPRPRISRYVLLNKFYLFHRATLTRSAILLQLISSPNIFSKLYLSVMFVFIFSPANSPSRVWLSCIESILSLGVGTLYNLGLLDMLLAELLRRLLLKHLKQPPRVSDINAKNPRRKPAPRSKNIPWVSSKAKERSSTAKVFKLDPLAWRK